MKFAFLPHYFKKVGIAGLFVFIAIIVATSIIATIQALQHGTPPLGGGFTEGYQYGTVMKVGHNNEFRGSSWKKAEKPA